MTLRARVGKFVPAPVRRATKRGVRVLFTAPTSRMRVLPDFLIIGVQRAGTTSLYRYLTQHPAVRPIVLTKGAHYFDTNYHEGIDWYRAFFPTRWRKALIERRLGTRMLTGEGSPYYVFHPLAPHRIKEVLPDVKLILMLRDPVERAYSHYHHEVARGFETLSFEEAIRCEPQRLAGERERMIADPTYNSFEYQHHSYLARGRYLEQILTWHALFPPEQLLILKSEEFFAEPEAGFDRVLRFLGLPPWRPRKFERFNARRYAPMDPGTRRELIRHFAEPNRALAEYLGTELGWAS